MFKKLFRNFFFKEQVNKKKLLLELWHEINANLESYYVLDQRQFISTKFELQAWNEAQQFLKVRFPQELYDYAGAIKEFNASFAAMKGYEEFYSSSIDNKTRANAETLHGMQEVLESRVLNMKEKITRARDTLRIILDKKS